jgi:hypothetical protein
MGGIGDISQTLTLAVMPGLVPGIHVLLCSRAKTWMAGHRRAEATPSFGRLCPAMTKKGQSRVLCSNIQRLVTPENAVLIEGDAAIA